MKRMDELARKINTLRKDIVDMEREIAELRLSELKKVAMKRNDSSVSLLFNGRTVNASRNRYGRLTVKAEGRVLVSDYFGNIHDLRFDIAQSQI